MDIMGGHLGVPLVWTRLACIVFDGGGKPEQPKETHLKDGERHYFNPERPVVAGLATFLL